MLGGGLKIMLPLKEAKIGSAALLHSQAMIARPLCGLQAENYTIQRYRCCTAGPHNYNLPRYSTSHLPHSLYMLYTALQVLYRGPAQL
jgi:hypothetical protein